MLDYDEARLAKELDGLSEAHRTAFAAACAQRLADCYAVFCDVTGRGDSPTLFAILERLWEDLEGRQLTAVELQDSIDKCRALIPREEDGPWVAEMAAAEDAVVSLTYALSCRRSGDVRDAVWVARRAYAALDNEVINRHGIDMNVAGARERVLFDPLIQAEFRRQERDLSELSGATVDVHALRERARKEATEFMGRKP